LEWLTGATIGFLEWCDYRVFGVADGCDDRVFGVAEARVRSRLFFPSLSNP
jgi:hypothetical protein